MDALENLVHLIDEFVTAGVRLERGAIQRIHVQVPRAQAVEAHLLRALLVDFFLEGEDELLDALVEGLAVGRGVVEAVLGKEDVVDIVLAVGILGNLLAEREEVVESLVERYLVLEAAFPHRTPGALA